MSLWTGSKEGRDLAQSEDSLLQLLFQAFQLCLSHRAFADSSRGEPRPQSQIDMGWVEHAPRARARVDHEHGMNSLKCACFEQDDFPSGQVAVRRVRQAAQLLAWRPNYRNRQPNLIGNI